MPLDMAKYLGLFASEAQEHLESLCREAVALEKGADPAAMDSIFRHAHSVKGMAASMGFERIATLAHRSEDLVDLFRRSRTPLTRNAADVLLAAADTLLLMVKTVGGGASEPDVSATIQRVIECVSAHASLAAAKAGTSPAANVPAPAPAPAAPAPVPASPTPVPSAAAAPASDGLPPRFAVKVRIAAACQVPGVRGFLVHKKLSLMGNVFEVRPSLDDLRAGRVPDGLMHLVVESQGPEAAESIRRVLSTVADLESVEVARVEEAPAHKAEEAPRAVGVEPSRTVRVRTEILDYFLDAAGELLLATAHLRELTRRLPEAHQGPLEEGVDRLKVVVKDLHDKVMSARMTPMSLITDRLPRAARDIARRRNREVDLVITGAEIELDRAILDDLSDPLLHILRNAIDHGLEDAETRAAAQKPARGRVSVTARRDREWVLLEVEDDGRGMDVAALKSKAVERGLVTADAAASMSEREALMLSCLPGVTTAREVTDVSGRGVGMDAVKRMVENVGGSLELETRSGRGTHITLRLPLTVAVVNVLLVGVGGEIFGIPMAKVKAVVEADPASLSRSRNSRVLSHAGTLVPVHALCELLSLERSLQPGPRPHLLVDADVGHVAVEVDQLLGHEEAVLKPLSRPLDLVPGLAGVTILGTGRPIFILDVPRLVAW